MQVAKPQAILRTDPENFNRYLHLPDSEFLLDRLDPEDDPEPAARSEISPFVENAVKFGIPHHENVVIFNASG